MIIHRIDRTSIPQPAKRTAVTAPAFKQTSLPCSKQKISAKRFLIEQFICGCVKRMQNSDFSKNPTIQKIEKELAKSGINARFKNDPQLAEYVTGAIKILKEHNVEIPHNILFAPSFLLKSGLAVWSETFPQKEAPIILSNKIYQNTSTNTNLSSTHPYHTFFHETGHWLHFKNDFDPQKNYEIWQKNADLERIKETVSQRATSYSDGSEFCAELFSGIISGKHYPDDIMLLAKSLKFPYEF